jgi:hypothetical protein
MKPSELSTKPQLKITDNCFNISIGDVGFAIIKGTKWEKYSINTEIELWECKEDKFVYQGDAKIIANWCGKIKNIKQICENEKHIQTLLSFIIKILQVDNNSISPQDKITILIYEKFTICFA